MAPTSIADLDPARTSRIRARWVVPVAADPIENGAVVVGEGRILAVGDDESTRALYPDAVEVDLGDSAIMPGLVNTHSHLELTAMRGVLEHSDFREWIATLTDIKMTRMTAEDLLDSARIGVLEAVRAGITTCADTCDTGVAMNALIEAGLGGIVYQEVFGPSPGQAAESLAKLKDKVSALLDLRRGSRVSAGVSPHAPYTVSADLFRGVAEYARAASLPMAIHTAESEAEDRFVRVGEGPFAARFAARGIPWHGRGTSTIGYLDELGVLDVRPLLIHAVHATDADIDAVERSRASIAHCPKSNAKFGHGVAPVAAMRRRGIAVGLGTDSVASNNVCDLLDEGRVAVFAARAAARSPGALAARDAIEMATLGGARALGLSDAIGSLEPGKRADLCVISLAGLHMAPIYDVETALVFSASRHDVTLTMASGRVVHSTVPGVESAQDEDRLRARLDEIRQRIVGN